MEPEIQARIERLYENESLTDNLTDANAKALLQWAEQQLRASTDETLVTAAMSFANTGENTEPDAILTQAQTFLTAQLHAHENTATRPASNTNASLEKIPAPPPQPQLVAAGASETSVRSDQQVTGDADAATTQPVKKKRRTAKRKTK